jgi:hypothetical protein
MPVEVDRHEVSWCDYGHHRDARRVSCQLAASSASCRQVGACIDDRNVGGVVMPVDIVGQGGVPHGLRERLECR